MNIKPQVASLPVQNLHLWLGSVNALKKIGIRSIGELIRAQSGTHRIKERNTRTSREVIEAGDALSGAVLPDGSVDWIRYAEKRGLRILPAANMRRWASRQFLQEFPRAISAAVRIRFGPTAVFILQERLLRPSNGRLKLDHIAQKLGVTWERVRQVEGAIVSTFRGILSDDNYCNCPFRFHPEFLKPLRLLAEAVTTDCNHELSPDEWEQVLRRVWDVSADEVRAQECFLLMCVGLKPFHSAESEKLERTGSHRLRATRKEIRCALVNAPTEGCSLVELVELIKRKMGRRAPTKIELSRIIESIPCVKKLTIRKGVPGHAYFMRTPGDMYERVLRKARKPIHFRDICAAVNQHHRRHAPLSPKVLSVQLQRDARFVAIGSSGFWALSTWRVETRDIVDIAATLLKEANRPMSEKSLHQLIGARRPVGRKSITPLLHDDPRFKRVPRGLWALAFS